MDEIYWELSNPRHLPPVEIYYEDNAAILIAALSISDHYSQGLDRE